MLNNRFLNVKVLNLFASKFKYIYLCNVKRKKGHPKGCPKDLLTRILPAKGGWRKTTNLITRYLTFWNK